MIKNFIKWFKKIFYQNAIKKRLLLANQGDANAQLKLGVMYYCGKGGVLKDDKEAVKWYKKAANQGHSYAQYNLGFMYSKGISVLKDDKEAAKWSKKAANQGHAEAQLILGAMYVNGKGVLKDMNKASYWIEKAYNNDDDKVFNLASVMWEKYELHKYKNKAK